MPDRPELRLANIESILASFQQKFARREQAFSHLAALEKHVIDYDNRFVREALVFLKNEFNEYAQAARELDFVAQKVQDLSIIVYAASQVGLAAAVVDPDSGLHLLDTKGYTSLTGYSSDELEVISWDDIVIDIEESRRVHPDGGKFSFSEVVVYKKSGDIVPVEIGVGTGNYNGKIAKVIYMRDISERKRMESEADELRRQREISKAVSDAMIATVAGISHDMASPLTGLEALRSLPREDISSVIYESMKNAVGILFELNRKLMNFAKGRSTEEIAFADAKELVLEVIPLVRNRYDSSGVELNYNLDCDCRILVQKTGLKTALQNLLDNALEAIVDAESKQIAGWEAKKVVDVYLKREKDLVVLTVKDTGIGMAEEQLSKLFRCIYSTKDKGRVSGFGMFTVYNFVTNNKGFIGAASEGIGKGAAFYVKFPYVEKQQQPL